MIEVFKIFDIFHKNTVAVLSSEISAITRCYNKKTFKSFSNKKVCRKFFTV